MQGEEGWVDALVTDEMLNSIDALVVSNNDAPGGTPPPWFTSVVQGEAPKDLEVLGVQGYGTFAPLHPKSKYQKTKWVVLEWRGSFRLVPELYLRAVLVKGAPLRLDEVPFWHGTEVHIATKETSPTRKTSRFNIPSGTVEYRKLWRDQNREKLRAASRKYQKKQRILVAAATKVLQKEPSTVSAASTKAPSILEQFAGSLGVSVDELTATEARTLPCPRCGTEIPYDTVCAWCKWGEKV